MNVCVAYYGLFRETHGNRLAPPCPAPPGKNPVDHAEEGLEIHTRARTLRELITELFPGARPQDHLMVVETQYGLMPVHAAVNGAIVDPRDYDDPILEEGARVAFMPPFAGG